MFSLCFRGSKVFPTEENDSHKLLKENEEKVFCPIIHKTIDKILAVFEVAEGQDLFYDAIALYKWVLKRQLEFLPPTFPHNRKIIGSEELEFLKHTYAAWTRSNTDMSWFGGEIHSLKTIHQKMNGQCEKQKNKKKKDKEKEEEEKTKKVI